MKRVWKVKWLIQIFIQWPLHNYFTWQKGTPLGTPLIFARLTLPRSLKKTFHGLVTEMHSYGVAKIKSVYFFFSWKWIVSDFIHKYCLKQNGLAVIEFCIGSWLFCVFFFINFIVHFNLKRKFCKHKNYYAKTISLTLTYYTFKYGVYHYLIIS